MSRESTQFNFTIEQQERFNLILDEIKNYTLI